MSPRTPPSTSPHEVADALAAGRPVVALESTIISHGMPYPQNVAMATEVEGIVRDHGAVPATIAILDGRLCIGLAPDELELLASDGNVTKVSVRDLPYVVARGQHGATTVAATMRLAAMAGHPGRSSPAASAACTAARSRPSTSAPTSPSSARPRSRSSPPA